MKNNLKVERARKDLTQEELAKMVGVTRQTINAIEKKRLIPSTLVALKLSRYFNVCVNDLFQLEERD